MATKRELRIFIIEDDRMFSKALEQKIERTFNGYNVRTSIFDSAEMANMYIAEQPDIAIVDYHLDSKYKGAMDGIRTIELFKKNSPSTEIIILTAEESVDIAVRAMNHGAHEYIVKNESVFRKLRLSLMQCMRINSLKRKLQEQRTWSLSALAVTVALFGTMIVLKLLMPTLF